eukprot:8547759-Ditylum_brightwellii.AAC.1
MLLKLVNDISSITATLHSNHTLTSLDVEDMGPSDVEDMDPDGSLETYDEILLHIKFATSTNRNNVSNPEAAGRDK